MNSNMRSLNQSDTTNTTDSEIVKSSWNLPIVFLATLVCAGAILGLSKLL